MLCKVCPAKHSATTAFDRHLIYYRISDDEPVAFSVVPAARHFPRRLLDPPGAK